MSLNNNLILLGVISAAHGIKGEVLIKTFISEESDLTEIEIFDEYGKIVKLADIRYNNKNGIICKINNITTRTEAESLAKKKLYCSRFSLPELAEDEFYYNDLVGMEVRIVDQTDGLQKTVGKINAVFNFGAGDIIEIKFDEGKSLMFPFDKHHFPEVYENYVVLNTNL